MKLYATTTSERANKGQGGNKFIETTFLIGDREKYLTVRIEHCKDIYTVTVSKSGENILNDRIIKGKRQKGENLETDYKTIRHY
jgi:hypothetical protein